MWLSLRYLCDSLPESLTLCRLGLYYFLSLSRSHPPRWAQSVWSRWLIPSEGSRPWSSTWGASTSIIDGCAASESVSHWNNCSVVGGRWVHYLQLLSHYLQLGHDSRQLIEIESICSESIRMRRLCFWSHFESLVRVVILRLWVTFVFWVSGWVILVFLSPPESLIINWVIVSHDKRLLKWFESCARYQLKRMSLAVLKVRTRF